MRVAVLEQRGDGGDVAALDRVQERGVAAVVETVHGRVGLPQQRAARLRVAPRRRHMQRGLAGVAAGVRVHVGLLEQLSDHGGVVALGRVVQRRVPVLVLVRERGRPPHEQLDDGQLPLPCGPHEGVFAFNVDEVHVAPRPHQRRRHAHVRRRDGRHQRRSPLRFLHVLVHCRETQQLRHGRAVPFPCRHDEQRRTVVVRQLLVQLGDIARGRLDAEQEVVLASGSEEEEKKVKKEQGEEGKGQGHRGFAAAKFQFLNSLTGIAYFLYATPSWHLPFARCLWALHFRLDMFLHTFSMRRVPANLRPQTPPPRR